MEQTNNNYLNKIPRYNKTSPQTMAQISKLVSVDENKLNLGITNNTRQVAASIKDRIEHNDDILQLFPDTELPIQILVSSIISPNDMVSVTLNYNAPKNLKLPQDLKASLIETIKEYVNSEYDLEFNLYDMIKEALFTKGAYIEAVIPEAALDDVVNQFQNTSFEAATDYYMDYNRRDFTVLSNKIDNIEIKNGKTNQKEVYSMEEMLGITVTENPSVLRLPKVKLNHVETKTKSKYSKFTNNDLSLEDNETLNNIFRPFNTFKEQEIVKINTDDFTSRKNLSKPLVMKLPVESVIPVHVKNNPKKHLGYFVVLDESGIPITKDYINSDMFGNNSDVLQYNTNNSGISDTKLNLITKAREELYGITKKDPKLENTDKTYDKILEQYLNTKIKDGEIGDLGTIAEKFDLYNVMLTRALKNQKTQLLYLPAETVSYLAFDYRENGTGKSLLEKAAILYSIRAILFFTKVMANIRNSITNTEFNVTLGESIPNPHAVMESIISETLKTRETLFPVGIGRIDDIVNFVHRVGNKFNFKHPSLPEIDIEQNDLNRSMVVPDMDFDDSVKSMILMSFGLTPEIVEAGVQSDFATTVAAKNMLFAKRVNNLQIMVNKLLNEHVKRLLSFDPIIKSKLQDIVKENFKETKKFISKLKKDPLVEQQFGKMSEKKIIDHITCLFLEEIEVYLPSISTIEANGNKQAFDDYKQVLSDNLDIMFDTSVLSSDLIGPLSDKVEQLKGIIKTIALNKWLTDNNYLPELSQFLTKDDEGKPIFNMLDEFKTQYQNIFEAYLPFAKENKKIIEKRQEQLDKVENGSSDSDSSDDDSSDDDSGDTDDTGSDEGDSGADADDAGAADDAGDADDTGDADDDDGGFGGFGEPDEDGDDDGDMSDMGDMGMDDLDGESGSGSKSGGKQETKLDQELKKAKLEKEHFATQSAKAKAIIDYKKAGLDPTELEDENPTGLNKDDEESKEPNEEDDQNKDNTPDM